VGDRVDGVEHRLLVGAALGGRAGVLGGDVERLLALGLELDDLVLERRDLLVERAQVAVLLLGRAPHRGDRPGLEVRERVVRVGGRELLEQVLAHARRLLGHDRAQLVLDGDRRLGAEQPLELLGELAALGREDLVDALAEELRDEPRLLRERALDLARDLLELGPDEVGVDLGLLAREHARADLDRVDEDGRRVGARLGALAHEVDRAAVAHGEAVGDDDVADDRDTGLAQGRGGFHENLVARYGRRLTERLSRPGSR
jgi:hypothetical protein